MSTAKAAAPSQSAQIAQQRCLLHNKMRSASFLVYDEAKGGHICKDGFTCQAGAPGGQNRAFGLDVGTMMGGGEAGKGHAQERREVEEERKRRRADERMESEKRKEEKKRCEFCKRYTCVC